MKGQSVLSFIKKCNENFEELYSRRVSENKPELRSVPEIYNECQDEAADEFPGSSKEAFLQNFPNFKACQSTLYKERRTKVPPNPLEHVDIDIESDRFIYTDGWREESIIKGAL